MATDLELIGRAEPIATLRSALGDAAKGRGRLVVLSGEPGIGKSALTAFAAREAEERGAKVVFGRAWELGEAPPYFPLVPGLAALGIAPPSGAESEAFRLWERVVEALALLTERAPSSQPPSARASARTGTPFLVWILEDVHAADLGTLDLLTLLAQPLGSLRALVVVTARMQDPRITERVSQRLVRMARDGLEIRLLPLEPSEVAALAERTAGRRLPARTGDELADITGGNPLFVIECARAVVARGAAPSSIVPQTVRQVVGERVGLLSPPTIEALAAAAVLGRDASAATVGKMLGKLPAQVIDALHPALRAGILVEPRPGRFSFTHILVRDAVEEAILPAERAELHARAEAALEAQGDGVDILVERARHALMAMRDGQAAIDLALRAAALLDEQGAFDRAYAMYERVVEARRAGWGRPATSEEKLRFSRVAQKAGKFNEAERICEELIASAIAVSDAELLARAALTMGAEIRPAVVSRALVSALEEAARALEGLRPGHPLACVVRARLAAALQPALDPGVPVAMARRAIAEARVIGDDSLILDVLHLAGAALVDYAPSAELQAVAQETLDRALSVGDIPKAVQALVRMAVDHAEAGEYDAWWQATDRALELSQSLEHPGHRWRALLLGSMRALAQGDVAESDQILLEVRQIASVSDDPALALSLEGHVGGAARLLHRDEYIGSLKELERPRPDVPFSEVIFPILAMGHLARTENRAAVVDRLSRLGSRARPLETEFGLFTLLLAEAYACAGSIDDCRRLRRIFEPWSARHFSGGHVGMSYEGPAVRVLGILDSVIGDHSSAERRLREALELATQRGLKSWVAQCEYDLASALVRAGRASDAAPLFAAAGDHAEEVGMPGLLTRARARLAAVPASTAPPSTPSVRVRAFAMSSEGEAWRIHFEGRSFAVRDSRGMQLLGRLFERKGEEIHVLALASDEAGTSMMDAVTADGIDARARSEYRARMRELDDALEEAERNADTGRADKLRREKAMIETELARAVGLGGRARSSGSPSERARVNVQRRLKDAISRIGESDEATGRFLEKVVRTGTYCCFYA